MYSLNFKIEIILWEHCTSHYLPCTNPSITALWFLICVEQSPCRRHGQCSVSAGHTGPAFLGYRMNWPLQSQIKRGFSWDFNQQYLDMGSLKSQSPACSPCTLQKSLYCCRFCRLCGLWKTSQWVQNNKVQHFYYFVSLLHLVFLILNNNFCNPAVFDSCSCSAALLFKNVYHNLPLVFCEISNSANNLPL